MQASFNNTIISITDIRRNVIGWSSSGKMGFKGSRKSTAHAAQLVSQDACRQAMGHGLRVPTREEINPLDNEQLIVELYSR